MAKKYLDDNGLLYFWQKIKNTFALLSHTHTKSQITDFPTIPSAGTGSSYPVMDGTRALGSQSGFARVDHVHPSDTTRVPTSRTVNGKALSSDVTLTTSDLTNDSGYITSADVPEGAAASTTTPKMNGTAAVGTETAFARGDHVHPTDTSRAAAGHTHGAITAGGAITTGAVDIANGDKFVITDSSNSHRIASTSIEFDGSTATKALTQKGTFETFNNYTHPTYTSKTSALYKITVDGTGHVSGTTAVAKSDITGLGIPAQDTTYSDATTSTHGLMSTSDKSKLDSLTISNGVIDSSNLPSYVDDVIEANVNPDRSGANWLVEGTDFGGTSITPDSGKIYVITGSVDDTGTTGVADDYIDNQYRWGGSAYVKLADGGVSSITNAEIDTIVAA